MAAKMSVEQPLWRALTGYRVLTLGYALFGFVWEIGQYARPVVGIGYLAVLTVWTCATLPRVASAVRCTRSFLAMDVTIAVVGVLISPLVDTGYRVAPTLPSVWVAGPVLACAIKGGWRHGALASGLVGLSNLLESVIENGGVTRSTVHNVLLLCVASIAIGYVVEVARASERTLAKALQLDAATRERERLARDIHDSVLQVLAMVQRRGTALGGEAAELGRMAGEQEIALRSLVSTGVVPQRPSGEPAEDGPGTAALPRQTAPEAKEERGRTAHTEGGDGPGESGPAACDLRALIAPYSGSGVGFAEPGAPVHLQPEAARELAAAVGAALDNVRRHTQGPDGTPAQAWILLEDEPDEVIVTVRDDGPGIPAGRLDDAAAEGRMGVALSIRGRLRDLGGSAELMSLPGQGTEVELRVPK